MVKKDLTEEKWNELIEKYKNGAAGTTLCREFDITYYTLRKKLDELNLPTNNKKNFIKKEPSTRRPLTNSYFPEQLRTTKG